MNPFNIPSLNRHQLATTVPTAVYGGGTIRDPASMLFVWRSTATEKASGGTLAFYLDDARLEPLWARPEHYAKQFADCGITVVCEPDFSLWTDAAVIQQAYNIFRMRTVACLWQDSGLRIMPNLTWSDERSFAFAFAGIPCQAPVVATECRTAGSNDDDRRSFLRGLTEAVHQLAPQHICIYGGATHAYWLHGHLPEGPAYTLLPSFHDERGKVRAAHARHARDQHQLNLFQGGTTVWADAAVVAA